MNLPRISCAVHVYGSPLVLAGLMGRGCGLTISCAYARKSFVPCRAPVGLRPRPLPCPIGVPSVSLELDGGEGVTYNCRVRNVYS